MGVNSNENVLFGSENVNAALDAKYQIQDHRSKVHFPKWLMHRNKSSKEGPNWVSKTKEW